MRKKRVLTLRTVVATSAGLTLATSSFVAAAQVASFMAGDSAWLAILIGGVLCLLAGACFSELNSILPSSLGILLYLRKAFGEKFALIFSMLYMFVVMGVVGAESFVLAKIFNYAIPLVAPIVWITVMLVGVTLLNIRGIKPAGRFQDIVTYGVIGSMILISLWGLKLVDFHIAAPLATGGVSNFIQAVAVGIFLFVGFEWVTPLAEEVIDSRIISRGMFIAIGIVCVVYALFTMAMTTNMAHEAIFRSPGLLATPIPQVLFAQKVLGEVGLVWILLVCLSCSFGTFNAGLLTVSRLIYATAREHVLPRMFSRISTRFMTPWAAIVSVFVVGYAFSLYILYTGKYLVLVDMAAATESIIYVLSAAAVLALRKKMADAVRSFKVPFGPVIPVFTMLMFAVLAVMAIITDPVMVFWLLGAVLVIGLYVVFVVPRLKEQHRQAHKREERPAS